MTGNRLESTQAAITADFDPSVYQMPCPAVPFAGQAVKKIVDEAFASDTKFSIIQ